MNKSNNPAFNLATITTYQSGVIQSQVHRRLAHAVNGFLKPYNLTMMEWFALGFVRDAGQDGVRLTDLAKTLQTTLPYTTNLINHLESKSLVEREGHGSDNRAKLLRLSADTAALCDEIEAYLRDRMRKLIYDKISRQDFQSYIKVLYLLSK